MIPYSDNKFSALNTAVWSGGSFIYVPKGVHVEMPVNLLRINAQNMGQFERTLIALMRERHPLRQAARHHLSTDSLHSAVVELIAMKERRLISTIQNWSANVYNLVTKRGVAHENATVEWVDGNIGSKLTMKYPPFCSRVKALTPRSSLWPMPVGSTPRRRCQGSPPRTQHTSTFSQSPFPRTAAARPRECFR